MLNARCPLRVSTFLCAGEAHCGRAEAAEGAQAGGCREAGGGARAQEGAACQEAQEGACWCALSAAWYTCTGCTSADISRTGVHFTAFCTPASGNAVRCGCDSEPDTGKLHVCSTLSGGLKASRAAFAATTPVQGLMCTSWGPQRSRRRSPCPSRRRPLPSLLLHSRPQRRPQRARRPQQRSVHQLPTCRHSLWRQLCSNASMTQHSRLVAAVECTPVYSCGRTDNIVWSTGMLGVWSGGLLASCLHSDLKRFTWVPHITLPDY